jgi:hypothetical protein
MENLTVKSARFISTPPGFSGLISAELEALVAGPGDIFALVKIGGRDEQTRELMTSLIRETLSHFAQTVTPETNIPRRFEQIIQTINDGVSDLLAAGSRLNANDWQAVIGVVSSGQVFVTGLGGLHALFLHRTQKQRYVIYELDKQFGADERPEPNKPFVTILDGELHPGDVFYVATRVPAREIDLAELQDILVTLPPVSALKRIEQHLGPETAYGGICFQVMEDDVSGPPVKTNPLTSIEQLGKTQDETAAFLGEQQPDVVGWVGKITTPLIKKLSAPGTRGARSSLRRLLRFLIKIISAAAVFITLVLARAWRLTKVIVSATRRFYQEKLGNKNVRQQFVSKITGLSKTAKISILIGTVLSFGIILGLGVYRHQATASKLAAEFEKNLKTVEEKRTAADASLIYNNKDQARALLSEAQALLDAAPHDSPEHEAAIEKLQAELDASFFTLRGATPVQPKIIGTAEALGVTTFQTGLLIDNTIYLLSNQGQLFTYSELNSQFSAVELTRGTIGTPLQATAAKNGLLFLDNAKRLGRVNLEAKTSNPIVSGTEKLASANDLVLYNDNLYILSSSAQQIIKMRPQGDGYEAGTAWITSRSSDLTKATAMAVDGDIYVIAGSNVVKFSSGREGALTLSQIDPSLQSPTAIWTSLESKYLYLLEPSQSRVIVYDKQGKFVAQYLSDGFQTGRELLIREDKKEVVVITESQILTFTADHLLK